MELIDNIQQYKLYVDALRVSGSTDLLFYHESGYMSSIPDNDFWFPLFLQRTSEIFEYVQVSKDEEIVSIQRQEVNPFFIELSFFDSINQHKILTGSDLNVNMINFIKTVRIETLNFTNQEVADWFNNIGVNELPWFKGTNNEVTADDIDSINFLNTHTISKAKYYNIDINK